MGERVLFFGSPGGSLSSDVAPSPVPSPSVGERVSYVYGSLFFTKGDTQVASYLVQVQ
jgi:hypothetical protein